MLQNGLSRLTSRHVLETYTSTLQPRVNFMPHPPCYDQRRCKGAKQKHCCINYQNQSSPHPRLHDRHLGEQFNVKFEALRHTNSAVDALCRIAASDTAKCMLHCKGSPNSFQEASTRNTDEGSSPVLQIQKHHLNAADKQGTLCGWPPFVLLRIIIVHVT